ncbi:MAG: hypothetical protein WAW41_07900 [Methylobacter sp.]
MAGLLETLQNLRFNPSPLSTGLMLGGANMMQAGGPSLHPQNFGSAMGAGLQGLLQGYVGARETDYERERQKQEFELDQLYKRAQLEQLQNPNKFAAATPGQWYIPPGAKEETFGGMAGYRTPDGAFIPSRSAMTDYQSAMTNPGKLATISEAKKRGEGLGALVERETPQGTEKGFYGDFTGTNPGNMRVPGKQEFQQFGSRSGGLDAIEKQLALYGDRGINTLSAIASTWAPPNENDTPNYIKNLSAFTGYRPDAALNLKDPVVLRALSSAISRQEGAPVYAQQGGVITGPTKTQQKQADIVTEAQGAGLKKQAEAQAEARNSLPGAEDNAAYAMQLLSDLKQHPGLPDVVGMPDLLSMRGRVPGTQGANFNARLNQIKGGQFLEAIQKLRGTGQITEIEGKKATDAIARLDPNMSEAEFIQAIDEAADRIRQGLQVSKTKAGMNQAIPQAEQSSQGRIKFLGFE